jgi:hypothetical protein
MPGLLRMRWAGFAAWLALASFAATLSAEEFTFEDVDVGFYPSSFAVTNGGLTLTITPEGYPTGYVAVESSFVGVPLLGSNAVIGSDSSAFSTGGFLPLRFSFSSLVSAITFAFGDAGGDNDTPVTIEAFNAANVSLGVLSETYPADFALGKSLSGSYAGASYFVLRSDSPDGNAHSIFWDVTSVTPIPEPSAVALVGFGVLGLGDRQARRRRQTG